MEISGSQKIKAPRPQVFQALLTPSVLKNSIPGCEDAAEETHPDGKYIKLVVSPNIPGFKGPYTIYALLSEIEPPTRVVLTASPSSSIGSIKAVCAITLTDEADGTLLSYNATADIQGKIAATPEFIMKNVVKGALDHFFKNFDKQVHSIAI
ncbi:MAG TPA: carbon monoxide dehydrogenase subunit G [Ktedonobacteraceae bacterium]|nr:carbon monoxide dehydrogenase subunit G [Ktedonobacteraceae bacterium]